MGLFRPVAGQLKVSTIAQQCRLADQLNAHLCHILHHTKWRQRELLLLELLDTRPITISTARG